VGLFCRNVKSTLSSSSPSCDVYSLCCFSTWNVYEKSRRGREMLYLFIELWRPSKVKVISRECLSIQSTLSWSIFTPGNQADEGLRDVVALCLRLESRLCQVFFCTARITFSILKTTHPWGRVVFNILRPITLNFSNLWSFWLKINLVLSKILVSKGLDHGQTHWHWKWDMLNARNFSKTLIL